MPSYSITSIIQLFREAVSGKEHDFRTGSIRRAVFMLSVPMILERLMESIFAIVDIFYSYGMVVINAFNGVGDTKTPTKINFMCFWLFQLPFAYLILPFLMNR